MPRKDKSDLTDPFKSTGAKPAKPKVRSGGFSLREDALAELDAIAGELNVSRNAVVRWALLNFINQYRAGNLKPDVETRATLTMPDLDLED